MKKIVKLTDKYLTGEFVLKLTDKTFEIMTAGKLENMQQVDGTSKENLVISIKLAPGTVIDWIPNETSKKTMRKAWGDDTEKWIGKKGEFEMAKQNVRGEMKDVIFVKQ